MDDKSLSFPDWDVHCILKYPEHKKMLFYQQKVTKSLRSVGDAVGIGPLSWFPGHVQRELLASLTIAKDTNIFNV